LTVGIAYSFIKLLYTKFLLNKN